MRLTVLGQAICILVTFILLFSIFYSTVFAIAVAFLILLFLFLEGIWFINSENSIKKIISIERIASPLIIRQGGKVDVIIRGNFANNSPYKLTIKDNPPHGSILENGSFSNVISSRNSGEWSYCISINSIGNVRFEGLELIFEGIFFKDSIVLKDKNFRIPVLHIEPTGILIPARSSGLSGEREWHGKGFLKGSDIRGFRDYNPSDDYRHIDWKLTAKYNKLMIKLYSGLSGTPPYIILDIPSDIYENALNDYHILVRGVVGAIANAEREWKAWSMLIISGTNLINFLPLEKNRKKILEIISALKPLRRQNNDYRLLDSVRIKRYQYNTEENLRISINPADLIFYENLSKYFIISRENTRITQFESQMQRIFDLQKSSGVYLFSDFKGDISHIEKIITEAKKRGIVVHGRAPPGVKNPGILRVLASYRIDSFEVIS